MKMQGRAILHDSFLLHLTGYTQWLQRLGYAEATIYTYRQQLHKFLAWLQSNNYQLDKLNQSCLHEYAKWLNYRPNEKKSGALCISMIRGYLQVIHSFAEYLLYQEGKTIPVPDLSTVSLRQRLGIHYAILTREEIHRLYQATDNSLSGLRNRAMLSLYYGCGLRRKEGLQLQKDDIDWKRNYLHVRKGKGGKDRIIPFTGTVAGDLRAALQEGQENVLPVGGQAVLDRLKRLSQKAGIEREVTVHGLRHSIATHLLQQGMPLEQIRVFLGHSSLETTQKYVHIVHELE
jgi:integrase/recombinase XerD